MNYCFIGFHFHGNFAESNFGITTIESAHNSLSPFRVSRGNTQYFTKIDVAKFFMNTFINGQWHIIIETAQIDIFKILAEFHAECASPIEAKISRAANDMSTMFTYPEAITLPKLYSRVLA